MAIHFFNSDLDKNMFLENEYFTRSFGSYSLDNESFLGSLLAIPLQIVLEELVYSLKTLAHLSVIISEFTIGLSTHDNASQHFYNAGENFLHACAYLAMIVLTPFYAVFRPLTRLCSTCSDENPPAYNSQINKAI